MSPPSFLMVDFSTVLSLARLPSMSFPQTHKLSQHLYLNLHQILYSVGIVENTREYAKRSFSFLRIILSENTAIFTNQLLTSTIQPLQHNARCKQINNAPEQRVRKLLEGLNSLISRSPKHPGTPAPRAHTQHPEGLEAFKYVYN